MNLVACPVDHQPSISRSAASCAARLLALAALLLSFGSAMGQAYTLSPIWSIAPESPGYEWMSTNHTQRGLAYNPATGHLLTVSRFPATNAAVYILSAADGSILGNLSTNGVFDGINFPLNLVGVAADGVIYACNLTVDSTNAPVNNNGPFRIYRWANEAAEPVAAYVGDPSDADPDINARRFGDSMAVRGSGTATEIIAGSRLGKVVARFTTTDGVNFTHQKIDAPDLPGVPFMVTIAFGAGDTFWVKPEGQLSTNYPLQHFSFDPGTGTATLLASYGDGELAGGPLAYDTDRNLLAVVRTKAHELSLHRLTAAGLVPQDQPRSFPGTNANGNFTGAIAVSSDRLFALESNNGLMAFSIGTNALAPFSAAVAVQPSGAVLSWPSSSGFIYQPQFKNAVGDVFWTDLGGATNGTGSTISVTDAEEAATRLYRVRAD